MRKSLFLRIFAALAFVGALAASSSAFFAACTARDGAYRALTDGLERTARAMGAVLDPAAPFLQDAVRASGRASGVRLTFLGPDGRVLADSEQDPAAMENHAERPEVRGALRGGTGTSRRVSATTGASMVYVAVPLLRDGRVAGAVRASDYEDRFERREAGTEAGFALFAASILLACLAAAFLLSRALLSPLRALTDAVRRFTEGNHGARARLGAGGEIGNLADAFDSMADRIQMQFHEITARSEELDGIFSSVPQGIAVLDAKGRIRRTNAGFREIVGSGAPEGRELWDAVRAPRLADLAAAAREPGPRPSEEIEVEGRVALCSITPLPGGDGLIAVLHDVTDARRLEAMKRDFVVNASHELRTPLTAIRGYLEMLEEEVSGDAAKWLSTVRRSADRMAAIVEDLLSLARLEGREAELRPEPVDVLRILSDAQALFEPKARAKGLALRVEVSDPPPALLGDEFLLEQMTANLVDNAVKYTESGEVRISCRAEGDRVAFEFSDTGIGIPESHIPRIFERFYVVDKSRSRKMGGTGLGLSIVKHVAAVHGGTVSVESSIGRGTRFTVLLPARSPSERAGPTEPPGAGNAGGTPPDAGVDGRRKGG